MTTFGIIFLTLIFGGFLYLIYKFINETFDGWGEKLVIGFLSTLFGGIILMLILFVFFYVINSIGSKYELDNHYSYIKIEVLSAKNNVNGDFFLGTGHIDEKEYIYYLTNSEKGYRINKMEYSDNVYIKESESLPIIKFENLKCTHVNWFISLFLKDKSIFDKEGDIIFLVPKGSVNKNFNVDISNL